MGQHVFKKVTVLRSDAVDFEFDDGRHVTKNFGVKRSILQNASMRKGGKYWEFRDGTKVHADDLYAEMLSKA